MPVYDYLCEACGPFSDVVPMAEFAMPRPCPACHDAAPRAILAVPNFSGMSGAKRTAHAVNERSAHAPETTARTGRHPPGCGCCRANVKPKDGKVAMKSFAGTRPWMISH